MSVLAKSLQKNSFGFVADGKVYIIDNYKRGSGAVGVNGYLNKNINRIPRRYLHVGKTGAGNAIYINAVLGAL